MIEQRELLELIHGGRPRSTPMRFGLRRRVDRQLEALARDRLNANSRSRLVTWGTHPPQPGYDETERQCWVDGPDRYRFETENRVTVVVGRQVFTWSEGSESYVRPRGDDCSWPGSDLLDGRPLLATALLDVHGTTHFLGRPAHLVRATPLPDESSWSGSARPPTRAEGQELVVDAELGIVLRAETLLYGGALEVYEVTDLEIDPVFADDLFAFRAPDGSEPHVLPDDFAPVAMSELHEVSAAAGFRVLVPAKVDAHRPSARVYRQKNGNVEVYLEYRLRGGPRPGVSLEIRQRTGAPPDLPASALRKIEEGGSWRHGGSVLVERNGVWVELGRGMRLELGAAPPPLPVDELAAYAESLVPLPDEPPPLVPVPEHDAARPR